MNLIEEIKNDAAGLKTLTDWLGEGLHPVPQAQADHRSLACVSGNNGDPCPHNRGGKWWERQIKNPIADAMLRQIEVKNQIKISTPFDESLSVCDVCGCCLKLLIWTPIDIIKRRTNPETISNYPAHCWKRIELENLG